MSETRTRALLEAFFAAFNEGDLSAALKHVSEAVAFDTIDEGREIGRDKVHWRLRLMRLQFDERFSDIVVMTAPGGVRAAAEFTVKGIYASAEGAHAGGETYALQAGMFFEVDEDQITRISIHRYPVKGEEPSQTAG